MSEQLVWDWLKRRPFKNGQPALSDDAKLHQYLWRKYRITSDVYAWMLERQGGRCAICDRKPAKRLAVDHNHTTGEVRGLLCNPCNQLVGTVELNATMLDRIKRYLNQL